MDVQRKGVKKRKTIVYSIVGVLLLVGLVGAWRWARNLKPAAPGVDLSTLWPDTVKRGPMVREVRGLGTLVPEDTVLLTATTDSTVKKIMVKPGVPVKADTVIMVMTSPELETDFSAAKFAMLGAQADYDNLKITLEKARLDLQSALAQTKADYSTAKLESDRDTALAKDNLLAVTDAKISQVKAEQLAEKLKIDQQRFDSDDAAQKAQLEAQQVKLDNFKAQFDLKKSQVDKLNIRAGVDGMLQSVPPPLVPVEEGQKVPSGTVLGKIAQPGHLKAELKIAETQIRDVAIGQPSVIDTRLAGGGSTGLVNGHVSRIEQSIVNGTVTVDVALIAPLPPGSRADLSVDGTIQLEKLDNVIFVGRPVFGQENSTVTLFKIDPDGKYANKVKVTFGRSSVNTIEIKDGLQVGDRVILSDMSQYDQYDRIKLN
ncbi:MAG TPA: HlyD family efflux transporter periplasmic adaptor subunit [Bryobacteraceae bacterium]|jgi:HlyD family secretion protein|nr:HlyD family efflux transporter periplasmic adaptor subunit [Bryobacteraceae bacterium]